MLSSLARCSVRRVAVPALGPLRSLHVHEYISMEVMNEHDVPTPEGYVASTPEEAQSLYMHAFQIGKWREETIGRKASHVVRVCSL